MPRPRPWLSLPLATLLLFGAPYAIAQLPICRTAKELDRKIKIDEENRLVELKSLIPSIHYELRYATTANFVGRHMYPSNTRMTFLRKSPAEALKNVQAELNQNGLSLKIWDAYRPYSVTVAFWELIGDERYVANPAKGSGHNRGTAVDLTIFETNSGKELNMGTDFDHFSDSAHHGFKSLPSVVLENRSLLRSLMEKHGFRSYEEEWWHYSWPDAARFDILDIPFSKLKRYH